MAARARSRVASTQKAIMKLQRSLSCGALALLLGSCPTAWGLSLLAGWDFDPAQTGWKAGLVDSTGDFAGDGMINSNHSDHAYTGTIYWNGSHGSTAFTYAGFGQQVTTDEGTDSINQMIGARPFGPDFSTDTLDPQALAFNGTNGSFVVRVPKAGWDSVEVSYAARQQGDGTDAADAIAWGYSTDGINYTALNSLAVTANGLYQAFSFSLAGVSAVDSAGEVYLKGSMTGATGTLNSFNSLLAIDNLQVSAVPEPGFYAALLGLGSVALALLRRRA